MGNRIYKTCSLMLSELTSRNTKVIDANELTQKVLDIADFSDISEEELKEAYARNIVSVVLNSNNYYSVIRRKGYYANILTCRKAYRDAIARNATKDANNAQKLIDIINNIPEVAEISGQLAINPETMSIEEQMTEEELLLLLMEEAQGA